MRRTIVRHLLLGETIQELMFIELSSKIGIFIGQQIRRLFWRWEADWAASRRLFTIFTNIDLLSIDKDLYISGISCGVNTQ